MFLQQLLNGLTIGSVYALVAVGYTMVFGVLKLVNFANGSVYMLGGYLTLMLYLALKGQFWLCFLLGIIGCAITGYALDFFGLRVLREQKAPRLAGLITTMGISMVIDNSILIFFGSETKPFPNIFDFGRVHLGNSSISSNQIIIMLVAVLLMVLLSLLTYKSKLGKAMRAVSQNTDAAKLMGINVNKVISFTFMISSALAAVAGVLVGMYYQTLDINTGFSVGMKTMASAVLGGVGVLPGAMVGGLIIGIVETLGASYISSGYRNAFAFAILIIIILVKPNGLFGKDGIAKV